MPLRAETCTPPANLVAWWSGYGHCFDLIDTNWHHLAVVADGADPIEVYLDGAVQELTGVHGSTADRFFSHATRASTMTLGAVVRDLAFAEGVKVIDELAVYDRALAATEIAALHGAGSAAKCKPAFPVPAGLLSWWRGENDAGDAAARNPGVSMGAVGYGVGRVGQAFGFNGATAYLVMPPVLTNAMAFTFEWWMKVRRFTHASYTPVFCQPCESQLASCIPGEYWFYAGDETSYGSFRFAFVGHDGNNGDLHTVLPFGVGTWEHAALTYDGARLRLYWNGQGFAEQAMAGAVLGNATPFWVGRAFVPHTDGRHETAHLDGQIDELTVYGRALAADEIAAICAAGSAGKAITPPLAASLGPGGVTLSWPDNLPGLGLVSCPDLGAGDWVAVTNEPALRGGRKEVLVSPEASRQFFRLR